MKLNEKIVYLRKRSGMSQDEAAEKLNISRQALSRWENGTAQPSAGNIVEISRLFGTTADYLLNDDYQSDEDLPQIREVKESNFRQMMVILVTLEVMDLILQFITVFTLQSTVLEILSFIPFVAILGYFEYFYRKNRNTGNEKKIRSRFYTISAWIGLYFPIRLILMDLMLYPRPVNMLVLECAVIAVYLITASLITIVIRKRNRK